MEVDLAKSQGRQLSTESGYKQTETVTGHFSSIIIELTRDQLHALGQKDQAAVYDAEIQDVDNIRLIKTNKSFYRRLVCLWLKFRAVQTAEQLRSKTVPQ